jgi:hypothetical protein
MGPSVADGAVAPGRVALMVPSLEGRGRLNRTRRAVWAQ